MELRSIDANSSGFELSLWLGYLLPHEFDIHPQVIELIRKGERYGELCHFLFDAVECLQTVRVWLG